jgi:hypothetical protein
MGRVRSGWLWGGVAAVALVVGIVFLVVGNHVDLSDACRSVERQRAEDRAERLFDVALAASAVAVAACAFD